MTGTGIIIHKNDYSIVIVTAFHVIIPQYLLTLNEFIILNVFVLLLVSFLWYIKVNLFNCASLIFIIFYSFFCCNLRNNIAQKHAKIFFKMKYQDLFYSVYVFGIFLMNQIQLYLVLIIPILKRYKVYFYYYFE